LSFEDIKVLARYFSFKRGLDENPTQRMNEPGATFVEEQDGNERQTMLSLICSSASYYVATNIAITDVILFEYM
jgi:hypothetical protein